jgi:hypothetical protein
MQNLLTWRFWFNLRPESLLPLFTNLFLGLLALLLIATIFTALKQRRKSLYKNFWKRSYGFSLGNLLIGAVLFFFNYERAAFLSARFWLALWVIVMIAWLIPIIKSYRRVPLQKKKIEKEQEFKKYIP